MNDTSYSNGFNNNFVSTTMSKMQMSVNEGGLSKRPATQLSRNNHKKVMDLPKATATAQSFFNPYTSTTVNINKLDVAKNDSNGLLLLSDPTKTFDSATPKPFSQSLDTNKINKN